jgi:hypothetical protein
MHEGGEKKNDVLYLTHNHKKIACKDITVYFIKFESYK